MQEALDPAHLEELMNREREREREGGRERERERQKKRKQEQARQREAKSDGSFCKRIPGQIPAVFFCGFYSILFGVFAP